MENYVRYFVKFFMIVLITGLAFLFVVVIKNNTSSKLDKNTNLTNVIDNDEADNNSGEEAEKTTPTKQTDSKNESNVNSSSSTNSKTNSTTSSTTDNKSNTEKDTSTVSKATNDQSTNNVSNTTTANKAETVQENISSPVDKNVEFSLSFDTKTLTVGETSKIAVNSNEKNLTINYKSFDESVVSVDKYGTIKALKPGNTYLEVNVNYDSSKIVEISVNAKPDTNTVTKNENNAANNSQNSSSNTSISQTVSDAKQPNNQTSTSNDSKTNDSTQTSTSSNDQSSTSNGSQPSQETKKEKNGWYTINGKKYYYKNGVKVKNSYVDYIYLNKNGVAQSKIGTFSATLYGATAWTNQSVNIRKAASQSSTLLGEIPVGGKVVILSAENASTKYIKIKYNNITGYVYSDFLLINLPDVIPDMLYEITSASSVTSKTANVAIPGVTGKNLYGFTKKYNSKIGKETYYAPLLYPTAKKLQKAYNKAKKEGYNLKVYDAYRPHDITVSLNDKFRNLYNSNSKVKKAIDYDKDGEYWGPSWFLAGSVSAHNKGVALDIAITNSKNQELKAQTAYDTLDTTSLVKYNNSVSNKLRSIMLSQGFSPLESEWWHFQDNNYYSNSPVSTFHLK